MPVLSRKRLFWLPKSVRDPAAGVSLDSATTAWINAVVADGGAVSATQQTRVNTLILALKGHSLFTVLDRLWLYGGESDAHQAKIDIINLGTGTISGTPAAFGAGGYTGDASTFYISTGVNPNSGGIHYVQDSASYGAYIRSSRTTKQGWAAMGTANNKNNYLQALRDVSGSAYVRYGSNAAGQIIVANTNAQGFYISARTVSTDVVLYKNGSLFDTQASVSTGVDNATFAVFDAGVAVGIATGDQQAAAFIGGGLSATQAGNLSTDLNAYMTSWGINVY